MIDRRARTLATLRETLRVARDVHATAVRLRCVEIARFEEGAIARLELRIRWLEVSDAAHRHRPAEPKGAAPPGIG